jgi:class 3 adenylate cyclase
MCSANQWLDHRAALPPSACNNETAMNSFADLDAPTERTLVVVFTDVTGFVKEFQNRTNREMFDLMSQFYELIGNEVEASRGKVVKFIGDAALLVYPEEHAERAVEALQQLKATADKWLKAHGLRGEFRIRAHMGPVVCGLLGTAGEKRFDVLGDTVNVTARLHSEGLTLSPELQRHLQS